MIPIVYEFRWDAGHILFLGAFYVVVGLIAAGLLAAALRTWRDSRAGRTEVLAWREEFRALPPERRACRHALSGLRPGRLCPNGFDCRQCEEHPRVLAGAAPPRAESGPALPDDRLYHRGHTWVRPEPDGTVAIGLEDFAARLIGEPSGVRLPAIGSRIVVHGTAFRVRTADAEARILSPVDGIVVATGGPGKGFWLRVRLDGDILDARHLLAADEARPWMVYERDRVQRLLAGAGTGPALANGGEPAEHLERAVPPAKRDAVLGDLFLDP